MKPKGLTHAQIQALRRMLHIVGNELIAVSKNPALPDTWEDYNMSYTNAAIERIYDMMADTKIVPKREG